MHCTGMERWLQTKKEFDTGQTRPPVVTRVSGGGVGDLEQEEDDDEIFSLPFEWQVI
jgi:hypothetical protein